MAELVADVTGIDIVEKKVRIASLVSVPETGNDQGAVQRARPDCTGYRGSGSESFRKEPADHVLERRQLHDFLHTERELGSIRRQSATFGRWSAPWLFTSLCLALLN
jgi:hypothetical protein